MNTNDAALDLIMEYEGFVDKWYPDPAHGWRVPTCCYGHTDAAGEPKFADTKHKRFSHAEGVEILKRDLQKYENYVRKYVSIALTENQFGALVSFTYNLGPANLKKSTLLRKLNAGDYVGASKEFPRWNRAAGKVLKGLTRRRNAEKALFLTPDAQTPPNPTQPTQNPIAALLAALWAFVLSLFSKGQ